MKKFSNTFMLILVIAAIFYFYIAMKPVKITTTELVQSYTENSSQVDKKYLTKELEISGNVKAFYELTNIGNVLELEDGNDEIYFYCFFLNSTLEDAARKLSQSDSIIFVGNCAGLKNYSLGEVLRFDVKKIK